MTGAEIVGARLRANTALIAIVAEANIKGGRLPEGAELPALLVRTVDVVDRKPLKRGAKNRRIDRVSVTVRAASYREQLHIIRIVRSIVPGNIASVGVAERIAITPAGTGPDLNGPGNTFEQGTDFRVSFDEPA